MSAQALPRSSRPARSWATRAERRSCSSGREGVDRTERRHPPLQPDDVPLGPVGIARLGFGALVLLVIANSLGELADPFGRGLDLEGRGAALVLRTRQHHGHLAAFGVEGGHGPLGEREVRRGGREALHRLGHGCLAPTHLHTRGAATGQGREHRELGGQHAELGRDPPRPGHRRRRRGNLEPASALRSLGGGPRRLDLEVTQGGGCGPGRSERHRGLVAHAGCVGAHLVEAPGELLDARAGGELGHGHGLAFRLAGTELGPDLLEAAPFTIQGFVAGIQAGARLHLLDAGGLEPIGIAPVRGLGGGNRCRGLSASLLGIPLRIHRFVGRDARFALVSGQLEGPTRAAAAAHPGRADHGAVGEDRPAAGRRDHLGGGVAVADQPGAG